ncbi:hypothetical protein B4U79_14540 [Dinothrombium tinctorium]|uniref:ELMO domain-containing protein n=1 Tax=Dinothrombium tinctorium TaxID=1965070 RepID=A0A443QHY6_9ACAR|nr:hypothetical protein B4U79_14540 [Dinothrombium tinctorium]
MDHENNSTDSAIDIEDVDYDLVRAQQEWNQITALPIIDLESQNQVYHHSAITIEFVDFDESENYFKYVDIAENLSRIKPTVQKGKIRSFASKLLLLEPPKLPDYLISERNRIFAIAFHPFDNQNPLHYRFLVTLYRKLTTQPAIKCPRYGNHWELIGFQGRDPATDLRGVGMLGIYQLLFFVLSPNTQQLSKDVYALSIDIKQNFPFCVMGTNITQIALQILREKRLNAECIKRKNVLLTFNYFYCGLYLKLYREWKLKKKTIADSGYVLKGAI